MTVWIVIAAAVLVTAAASFAVYRIAFYNRNDADLTYDVLTGEGYDEFHAEMIALIDEAVKVPFEKVHIRSCDGKLLFGRLYLRDPEAPFHIQCHGYKGNGIRDFSGGMLLVLRRNENLLLIDERSHGGSEGHTITFGVKERRDVISWLRYVNGRFGEDRTLYLEGISMGAASVLMAIGEGLPGNVAAVWADCPYSSPMDILKKVAAETVPVPWLVYPFLVTGALLFGHFNPFAASAVTAVKKARVPVTVIHGTGDRFVPVEMSRRIRDANPAMVRLVEVEGAPHGLSFLKDYALYEKEYTAFAATPRRKGE